MSVSIMALVWEKAPYKGSDLITLLALADWSDDSGVSWPSINTLAIKTRQSERNTQYCIRKLTKDNYLSVKKRKESSSQYRINISMLRGGAKIAPIPDEGVQNTTGGVQNGAENLPQIAPYTSEIHHKEHTLNIGPLLNDFSLTPKENGKTKKHTKVLEVILPDWLPAEEWNGWLEMRQKMHKAATPLAQKYAIEELDTLRISGQNVREVMRRAISKNWLAFYPIKTEQSNGNGFHNGQQSHTNGTGATGHLLDHLPDAEEIERCRRADDKRLEERRNARGM